jgi:hypothetical protein
MIDVPSPGHTPSTATPTPATPQMSVSPTATPSPLPIPISVTTQPTSHGQFKGNLLTWLGYALAIAVGLTLIFYFVKASKPLENEQLRDLGKTLLAIPAIGLALLSLLIVVLPLILPMILSRNEWLSVGRWASLAGFFFGLSLATLAFAYGSMPRYAWQNQPGFEIWSLLSGWLYMWCLGCLLASAFYPKDL